jgi:hypothetical protein
MNNKQEKSIKDIISEVVSKELKATIKESETDDQDNQKASNAPNKKDKIIQNVQQLGLEKFGKEVRKMFRNTIPDNVLDKDIFQYIKDNPESVAVSLSAIVGILRDKASLQKAFASKKMDSVLSKITNAELEGEEEVDGNDEKSTKKDASTPQPEEKKQNTIGVTAADMASNYDFVKTLGLKDPTNLNSNRSMIGQILTPAIEKFEKRLNNIRGLDSDPKENYALAKFYEDFEFTMDKAAEFFVKLMDKAEGDIEKFLGTMKRAQLVGSYTTDQELEMLDQLVELVHGDNDMSQATPEASTEIEELLKDDLMSDHPTFQSFRNLFAGLFEQVLANKTEDELENMLMSIGVSDAKNTAANVISVGKRRGRPPLPPEERARREAERKEALKKAREAERQAYKK